MHKRGLTLLLLAFVTMLTFAGDVVTGEYLSGLGDKKSYKLVAKVHTVEYCETFLKAFPESRYRKKVSALYDQVYYIAAYDKATKTFDLSMLEDYLKIFEKGAYRSKAEEALDIISWQKAKSEHTIPAYEHYIESFPKGRALPLARKALESFR